MKYHIVIELELELFNATHIKFRLFLKKSYWITNRIFTILNRRQDVENLLLRKYLFT